MADPIKVSQAAHNLDSLRQLLEYACEKALHTTSVDAVKRFEQAIRADQIEADARLADEFAIAAGRPSAQRSGMTIATAIRNQKGDQ